MISDGDSLTNEQLFQCQDLVHYMNISFLCYALLNSFKVMEKGCNNLQYEVIQQLKNCFSHCVKGN